MSTAPALQKPDWSATQYLKFSNERTRPVHDLLSEVRPHVRIEKPRIFDLGCGPGNSTQVLLDAFPAGRITGVDSSPDMLEKALASIPDIEFVRGDLSTFEVPKGKDESADILFSNAVFHWLRSPTRITTLVRLFESLKPGAVLAIQVPDNYHAPSHRAMRDTAAMPDAPWSPSFATVRIADLSDPTRPDLDPIEPPATFFNVLSPLAEIVNVWRTEYFHVLRDAGAVVEWVKGTGLMPYLNRIEGEEGRSAFLSEYERRVVEAYGEVEGGRVLLGYPRLFLVAVRK